MSSKPKYDVAIVGSGPAGAVTAMLLARTGRRVVMIDRERTSPRKVGESLPAMARPLLKHLNLLAILENGHHKPSFGNRSAWGSEKLQYVDFIADPNGLGWHLDRARFDADLILAANNAGTELIHGHVQEVMEDGGIWRIEGAGFETSAEWLIDASGRRAHIAAKLGVHRLRDSDLTAAYGWFKPLDQDDDPRTLVESSTDGWWYTARLPDCSLVAAFHTDIKTANVIARSPAMWSKLISSTRHTRSVLAGALNLGTIQFHEACGARLSRFGGKNWLATGDAALSFDPLSSQGIFNSLYTGMRAAVAVTSGDVASYSDSLNEIRAAYLAKNQTIYANEVRFSDRPFWRRRLLNRAVS
jgi:flavin-dependent dehydrogenase